MTLLKGQIKSLETIDVSLELQSSKIGDNQSLEFWINFDSNDIKAFLLSGNFCGTKHKQVLCCR